MKKNTALVTLCVGSHVLAAVDDPVPLPSHPSPIPPSSSFKRKQIIRGNPSRESFSLIPLSDSQPFPFTSTDIHSVVQLAPQESWHSDR